MKLLEYWWPKTYMFRVIWPDGSVDYINYELS
jgi:hypothetical protein